MSELLACLQKGTEADGGDGRKLLFTESRREGLTFRRLEEFRELGRQLHSQPIPVIPFHLYNLYDTTGNRHMFESCYFERRKRLDVFAVLALAEEDPKDLEALEDVLWAICDEYTWCLPAHLGGRSLEFDNDHRTVIDLFAAETAFYLAEITFLLEDRLSPIIVERARKEIMSRVLEPYVSLSQSYWWETTDMNWAAVCAGGIGAAAMYLIREDDVLTPLLYRVLGTIEGYLDGFTDDGACLEGLGYWNYGFGFYVAFAGLLLQRTAGRANFINREKIRRIAMFQQTCYLDGRSVTSFSDSSDSGSFQPGLTHYLKKWFDDVEVPGRESEAEILADTCFRWVHVIRNIVWYDASLAENKLGEAVYYLSEAQIVVNRSKLDGLSIGFSAKGGHNDEPHNHNDLGSFILLADGEQLLADPGAGVYTKEYFGAGRYEMIYNGSHGHSVPIVDGMYQKAGASYRSFVTHAEINESGIEYELDLTGAYGCGYLKFLVRRFSYDKREGKLSLKDDYAFTNCTGSFCERFVTFRKPELEREGLIRITGSNGAVLRIQYDPEQIKVELGQEKFVQGRIGKEVLYLVDLYVKDRKIKDTINITLWLERSGAQC